MQAEGENSREGRREEGWKEMREEEREKKGGLEGGQGGFGRWQGDGISGTLAVGEGREEKSVMTPGLGLSIWGFGLSILADAGTIHPSRGRQVFMMGERGEV